MLRDLPVRIMIGELALDTNEPIINRLFPHLLFACTVKLSHVQMKQDSSSLSFPFFLSLALLLIATLIGVK